MAHRPYNLYRVRHKLAFFPLILFLPGQQFQMHVLAHLGSQDPVSYV